MGKGNNMTNNDKTDYKTPAKIGVLTLIISMIVLWLAMEVVGYATTEYINHELDQKYNSEFKG